MCDEHIENETKEGYNHFTEEEEKIMTEILKKIEQVNLSPKQRDILGLSIDWNKNVSKAFVEMVIKVAQEYKPAIKELEKY